MEWKGRVWEYEVEVAFVVTNIADRAAPEAVRSCSKVFRQSGLATAGIRPYWTLVEGLV